MAKVPLTDHEVEIIEAHNKPLIDACDYNMKRLAALPKASQSEQTAGQILYWKQCRAGLKWSTLTAKQRRAKAPNVNK